MAEYGTLIRTQRLIQGQGKPCDYGCDYNELPEAIAYAKRAFPDKPYCVLGNWTWVDITVSDAETDTYTAAGTQPSVIYASDIIADEAHRPHLGPLVRTSPLCEFHRNCVFVTKNTAYILCGHGNRTAVSGGLITGLFF